MLRRPRPVGRRAGDGHDHLDGAGVDVRGAAGLQPNSLCIGAGRPFLPGLRRDPPAGRFPASFAAPGRRAGDARLPGRPGDRHRGTADVADPDPIRRSDRRRSSTGGARPGKAGRPVPDAALSPAGDRSPCWAGSYVFVDVASARSWSTAIGSLVAGRGRLSRLGLPRPRTGRRSTAMPDRRWIACVPAAGRVTSENSARLERAIRPEGTMSLDKSLKKAASLARAAMSCPGPSGWPCCKKTNAGRPTRASTTCPRPSTDGWPRAIRPEASPAKSLRARSVRPRCCRRGRRRNHARRAPIRAARPGIAVPDDRRARRLARAGDGHGPRAQRSVGISLISAISEKSRSVKPPTSWVDISIRTVR